ncbi:MAG TPA: tetratricopeptide repeat protein [Panacibacter sp.]|nr:tetratricopeptide repeat protein [Panacibacter sp.]
MKAKAAIVLSVFVLQLLALNVYPKNSAIDSLQKALQIQKEDTAKVNTLNALASEFRYYNNDTGLYFANQAVALATRLNYEIGIADAKIKLGQLYSIIGKYSEGIKTGNEALVLYNKLLASANPPNKENILFKIADSYNILFLNTFPQGNYPEALKIGFLELKIREKLNDKQGVSNAQFNIGNIYYCQHNYSEALKHHFACLAICKQLKDKVGVSSTYSAIGLVYFDQGNNEEASKYYSAALKLGKEVNDSFNLAEIYVNLILLEYKRKNYNEALKNGFAALTIYGKIGLNFNIPFVLNNMAMVYMDEKKYEDASEYLAKALSVAKETNHLEYIKLTYENFAVLDSLQGNYRKSLQDYKLAVTYRDSLMNKENTQKITQQQMQYEFDKKDAAAKAAQEEKDIITSAEIKRQKLIRNFSFALAFLILTFSAYIFYRYKKKKQLQSQQALTNERLRISRELHDEVGATLSGIAMYSHLTKAQIKNANTAEVEKSLNIMQESAGEMVNKLNDIVWLVNPDQDSLQKLIQRLEDYARDMAAIKNIHVKVNTPENLHKHSLPMECRRNIYLFCKEAINNAVKYSNGTLLELNIKEAGNLLEFSLSDNGKGFDVVTVRRGNGLENMQKRADEIGAKLTLESNQDAGSLVSMQIKIT